jgi:hypothetical protein
MKLIVFACFLLVSLAGCVDPVENAEPAQDHDEIFSETNPTNSPIEKGTTAQELDRPPVNLPKVMPSNDHHPPILHSDEFMEPEPLPSPVSSSGAEDSAFIRAEDDSLFFFFTPDPSIPVEEQILDGVTGIYHSKKTNDGWTHPKRVILNDDISLDGCQFVQGKRIWFCTARKGHTGVVWYTADFVNGEWKNWAPDNNLNNMKTGELHISSDGNDLYFHDDRVGGFGNYDIWHSRKTPDGWSDPENVEIINSPAREGWPYLSQDGSELWFTRTINGTPAIMRSKTNAGGSWTEPELMVSQFAGEPTLDSDGNLYFTHHFFENGTMLEADIYVANKKA